MRQGEELPGVDARRHEIVAGAFRRALGEHRRFDVDEAGIVKEAAERAGRFVTQQHVLLHLRTAQVQYAMLQAHGFGQVIVVELEGRGDRGVEDFDGVAQHFDFAAGEIGIDRAGRTRTHFAGDFEAKLVADRFRSGEHLRAVRIADDLGQAFAVAQVDENHSAVVAPAMGPAAQGDFLADELSVELSAVMSTHAGSVFRIGR